MNRFSRHTRVALDFVPRRLAQRADRGEDMSNIDLRGASLTNCDFRGASLAGVNFSFADVRGSLFQGADLRYSHFWNADISDCRCDHCDLTGADMDFATMEGAVFFKARLARVDLPLDTVTLDQIYLSVAIGMPVSTITGAPKKSRYAIYK